MITREDIAKFKQEELNEKLQASVDEYKIDIDQITDKQEILDKEQGLFKLQDEHGEYLSKKEYELPLDVNFEGKTYTKNYVTKQIIYFLNKMDVEWRFTLGMHQMVNILKNTDIKTIPYSGYDSILRTLNQLKFKGDSEWTDILIINDYLSVCHEEYAKDTAYLVYLSSLHNILLDRLKIIDSETVQNLPEA